MHHVTLDQWSRRSSALHRLEARAKTAACLGIILSLMLSRYPVGLALGSHLLLVLALVVAARLPLGGLLARAAVVLPFAGTVAAFNLLGGDRELAWSVAGKSFVSACAVLLLLGTTSLAALLRGLESMGVPRFFLMVVQFLYRYLFVLSEQAQHMRQARRCRAPHPARQPLFRSAAGALAVLFARSHARAERIHRAMLARGFQGHFILLDSPALGRADLVFLMTLAAALAALHITLWNP